MSAGTSPWHHADYAGPCRRCGGGVPNDERAGEYPGALSRLDNQTYICSRCGEEEAMFNWHYPNHPLPPINEPVFWRIRARNV